MPKSNKILPRKVILHGNVRWRIYVPKDIRNGKDQAKFFESRGEAEDFARELANNRAHHHLGWFRLSPDDQARVMNVLQRVKFDVKTIEFAVDQYLAGQPIDTEKTLGKVWAECVKAKELSGKSPRYVASLKSTLKRFCTPHELKRPFEITVKDVEAFINGGKFAQATRRGYITDIRTLFSFAMKRGYCATNPATKMERPTVTTGENEILTIKEVGQLLFTTLKVDKGMVRYFALQLFGGLRASEAMRIDGKAIQGEYLRIEPNQSKTRRRRLIRINPALKGWLEYLHGEWGPVNHAKRMRTISAALGWWKDNGLRKSFASHSLPVHGAAKTAEESGHSEQVLFRNYRELVTKEVAERYWKLTAERFLKAASKELKQASK